MSPTSYQAALPRSQEPTVGTTPRIVNAAGDRPREMGTRPQMKMRWRGATTMYYRVCAVMLFSLVLAAPTAHPARADATKGSQLAQLWCASCHVTGGTPAANLQQGPPSFSTIAHARTVDQLRSFLSHPHGAMPDLSLTRGGAAW